MKTLSFLFLLFFWSLPSYGQDLNASIILAQEPYCRTAGYQSGNGVLIGTFSGGTAPVNLQWLDSTSTPFSGPTANKPTTIIRHPGKYFLQVTDANGSFDLDSIIVLDSINPVANFDINSDDFYLTDPFEAYDRARIDLNIPTPLGQAEPPLNNDTVYCWTIENNSNSLKRFFTSRPDQAPDTLLNQVGINNICLIAKNYNNCRDTLCKKVSIVSSLILDPEIPTAVFPDYNSQTIQFHSKDFTKFHIINIYSIDGKLIQNINLAAPIQTVNFNHAKGVYVFSVILNDNAVASGKFVFGL